MIPVRRRPRGVMRTRRRPGRVRQWLGTDKTRAVTAALRLPKSPTPMKANGPRVAPARGERELRCRARVLTRSRGRSRAPPKGGTWKGCVARETRDVPGHRGRRSRRKSRTPRGRCSSSRRCRSSARGNRQREQAVRKERARARRKKVTRCAHANAGHERRPADVQMLQTPPPARNFRRRSTGRVRERNPAPGKRRWDVSRRYREGKGGTPWYAGRRGRTESSYMMLGVWGVKERAEKDRLRFKTERPEAMRARPLRPDAHIGPGVFSARFLLRPRAQPRGLRIRSSRHAGRNHVASHGGASDEVTARHCPSQHLHMRIFVSIWPRCDRQCLSRERSGRSPATAAAGRRGLVRRV